jgi:hypothetical protein
MSEPGIWSGPMVAIAPASAIAAHTAAAVRLVSWLSTLGVRALYLWNPHRTTTRIPAVRTSKAYIGTHAAEQ